MIKRGKSIFDINIKIVDSIMGKGKTSYAIQMMNEAPMDRHYIFVTPFIKEIDRIKAAVTDRTFKSPTVDKEHNTKMDSLKRLISEGADIAATHELFSRADDELMELLEWNNYTLILDEVMEVISLVQGMKRDDFKVLMDSNLIEITSYNKVIWKADPKLDTQYNKIRDFALTDNLFCSNNTAFVWNFPAKVFKLFEEVYVLTYMFDGQLQKYYYDLHFIKYDYYGVVRDNTGRYSLIPKSEVVEDRAMFKDIITIYEGKLNDVGNKKTSLSSSWFTNAYNKDNVITLRKNLKNYFTNITQSSSNAFMWTCYGEFSGKLKGNGYSTGTSKIDQDKHIIGCYTPFNIRATNDYIHKTNMAYCVNRYLNPLESNFFTQYNVTVDQDLLALSDLLQWLYRSAIREGQAINLYIPSSRMRELLKAWLDNEI